MFRPRRLFVLGFCLVSVQLSAATNAQEAFTEQKAAYSAAMEAPLDAYVAELAKSLSLQGTAYNQFPLQVMEPGQIGVMGYLGDTGWPAQGAVDKAKAAQGSAPEYAGTFQDQLPIQDIGAQVRVGLPRLSFLHAWDLAFQYRGKGLNEGQKTSGFGAQLRADVWKWGPLHLDLNLGYLFTTLDRERSEGIRWPSGGNVSRVAGYTAAYAWDESSINHVLQAQMQESAVEAALRLDYGWLRAKLGVCQAALSGQVDLRTDDAGDLTLNGGGSPSTYTAGSTASAHWQAAYAKMDFRLRGAVQVSWRRFFAGWGYEMAPGAGTTSTSIAGGLWFGPYRPKDAPKSGVKAPREKKAWRRPGL